MKKKKIDIGKYNPKKFVNTSPMLKTRLKENVIVTFGRFSPPTLGHERLITKMVSEGFETKSDVKVFVSHSYDTKTNPLMYEDKLNLMQIAFGNVIKESECKNIFDVLSEMNGKYKNITIFVGSDRLDEMNERLHKYNGKLYHFESIRIMSGGERLVESEDILESISASKMRNYVIENRIEDFRNGLPNKLKEYGESIFNLIKEGLGMDNEELLDENRRPLTYAERRKRAIVMRRYKRKIAVARKRAERRKASPEKLARRARRKAIGIMKNRLMKNKKYGDMTPAEKIALDRRMTRIPQSIIDRIAKRQLPVVRRAETARLAHMAKKLTSKNEDVNQVFENFYSNYMLSSINELMENVDQYKKKGMNDPKNREMGTISLVKNYLKRTPGQKNPFKHILENMYQIPNKEYGTKTRRSMPQIDDNNSFIRYIKKNDIAVNRVTKDPNELKPSQGQFNNDKVTSIINDIKTGKSKMSPVIISKDGHIIDGHHRWLAHANLNTPLSTIEIDTNKDDLIDLAKKYPGSFTKKLNEDLELYLEYAETCPLITKTQMKSFENVVDKLFAKFNIDFKFTGHFRERMSHERNDPCISLKELADTIKKIYSKYQKGDMSLSKYKDSEAVIKDLQKDLNMPIALEYDRNKDELTVIAKTIMRKKNFSTPNPIIKV